MDWQKLFGRTRPAPEVQSAVLAEDTQIAQAVQLIQQGELGRARDRFSEIQRQFPRNATALHALGFLAAQRQDWPPALDYLRQATEISPDNPMFQSDLGNALRLTGSFAAAAMAYDRAIKCAPDVAMFHANLGSMLRYTGDVVGAERSYQRAISLDPENHDQRVTLAHLLLLQGRYEEGFAMNEARFDVQGSALQGSVVSLLARYRAAGIPRWQGEPIEGKRLLIWAEQGFGDVIMALRYFPELKRKGVSELTLHGVEGLRRVSEQIPAIDRTVIDAESLLTRSSFDFHCPIMSLPRLMQTRLETIPAAIPYVHVPDALQQDWACRLGPTSMRRVGLVWAGNSHLQDDAARSIPLEQFAPLMNIAGIEWFSLQKGEPRAQLQRLGWPMWDRMDECTDFLDTAALIANLNLVISVDTSVAHLAGAMGSPVWLLNRFESEWRWMLRREDSPWYPTLRIFRQPSIGDWRPVILRLAEKLASAETFGPRIFQ